MVLKFILIAIYVFEFIYSRFESFLIWKQRSKPLPESVANIYDKEKYLKFLSYKKEYKKISLIKDLVSLIINLVIVLSSFYTLFDFKNPYLSFVFVYSLLFLINMIIDIPIEYYATFYIEEKFGKNHQTKKQFFKDYLVQNSLMIFASGIIFFVLIFIFENIGYWTNNFNITYKQSFLLCLMLLGIGFILHLVLMLISFIALRLEYSFTELEDLELRSKIEEYCKESKKKVHHIKVYDESKKSNAKNAFLLRIFTYREFGIADNFLDENSEDELLAVLLHEIGHLKHKKNIWNYSSIIIFGCLLCLLIWLIPNTQIFLNFNEWINESFGLLNTNYYLTFSIYICLISPFLQIFTIYQNYVSRKEEKEADLNAVSKGYGQALIDTFTKLSEDELIDVNPHWFIEFVNYSHPKMSSRIEYIQKMMQKECRKDVF